MKKRLFELHRENTALYFILLSRDTTASVGARSARRQQPHLVHHAHLLDQDPVGVQVRSLVAPRGGGGDRVAVAEAVVGQRLGPGS